MKKVRVFAVLAALASLGCFGQNHDKTSVGDNVGVSVKRAHYMASKPGSAASDAFRIGPNTVEICVIRAVTGERECQTNHNLKTTGGVDAIFQMIFNTQPSAAKYLYLSTNSTAPAAGDCAAGASNCTLTSVLTSNGLAPATATFAHTNGASTATLSYTWTAATAGTSNIQEAAIANNVTPGSGTVLFENTFTPVSLNVGDQLQLTWTITIS